MNKNFASIFKDLREEKGLLQKDIAKIFNISSSTVSGWEISCYEPNFDMLFVIAKYFGVSIDELLGYDSDNDNSRAITLHALFAEEEKLLRQYRKMDSVDKTVCSKYVEFIASGVRDKDLD